MFTARPCSLASTETARLDLATLAENQLRPGRACRRPRQWRRHFRRANRLQPRRRRRDSAAPHLPPPTSTVMATPISRCSTNNRLQRNLLRQGRRHVYLRSYCRLHRPQGSTQHRQPQRLARSRRRSEQGRQAGHPRWLESCSTFTARRPS